MNEFMRLLEKRWSDLRHVETERHWFLTAYAVIVAGTLSLIVKTGNSDTINAISYLFLVILGMIGACPIDHWVKPKSPSEWETVVKQGFTREFARGFGHVHGGFDTGIIVGSEEIREEYEVMTDHLVEVKTLLLTACFQVDLLEPNRYDLVQRTVANSARIIRRELIKETFPWCLITIFDEETVFSRTISV